jgi:regulator of protease activity HflC (stomatin/prohibitin superfamily)
MGVIVGILIALVCAGFIAWTCVAWNNDYKIQGIISAIGVGVSVLAFIFIPFNFTQIDTGEAAVVKVWGEAKEIKGEGLNFDSWISTRYVKYDLKTQEVKSEISAYSQDAQSMTANLTVQFRVQSDKLLEINKEYGELDVLTERIKAISEEKTKVVLASCSAMSLIETRSGLSAKVDEALKGVVGQYYIDITMVAVTDITFSNAFEETVEDKMIAEQEKLKAEYEKEKAIIQAEQQLEVAKKEAEAQLEKAKKEADAIEVKAEAEANALQIVKDAWDAIPDSVKQVMLQEMAIEKWNGELPYAMVGDEFLQWLMGAIKA